MNTPDSFEKRLSEIPMRDVPAGWRKEILRGALDRRTEEAAMPSPEGGVLSLLRQWLWPHPAAWGTLAAVWVVIVALNISSGVTSIPLSRQAALPPPSPELLALLREQRALLRSLLAEPTPPPPPVEPKPSARWFQREGVSWVANTVSKSFGTALNLPSTGARTPRPRETIGRDRADEVSALRGDLHDLELVPWDHGSRRDELHESQTASGARREWASCNSAFRGREVLMERSSWNV